MSFKCCVCVLIFVLYLIMFHYFKSFRVQLFFIFKLFRVKVSSHIRYHFLSNVVLINWFTFKYCPMSNFICVYFISYLSRSRGYLYLFIYFCFLFFGGQTQWPKAKFRIDTNPTSMQEVDYQAHIHAKGRLVSFSPLAKRPMHVPSLI